MNAPNSGRWFALSSFWVQDEHQLALVSLPADQIARYQFLRRQLTLMRAADPGVIQFIVNAQPVHWLDYNEELQERMTEDISEGEWEACVANKPADIEEPEISYVHITEHGLHFSCATETDEAQTSTITWAALEE